MPKSRFPKVYHSEVVPLGTDVLEHHGCSGVLLKGEGLSLEETTKEWNELPRNQSAMKRLPSTTSSLGRSFIGSLFESLGPEICRRRPSHQGAVRSSNHTGSSTRSSRPVHSSGHSVVHSFDHSLLVSEMGRQWLRKWSSNSFGNRSHCFCYLGERIRFGNKFFSAFVCVWVCVCVCNCAF